MAEGCAGLVLLLFTAEACLGPQATEGELALQDQLMMHFSNLNFTNSVKKNLGVEYFCNRIGMSNKTWWPH